MEVMFLIPMFKDYIWGGTNLKTKLGKESSSNRIAESWEISANKNGMSTIKNGQFKGKSLEYIFNNLKIREEIFGRKLNGYREFPILIKFIDAKNNLSVQVHPDDEFARIKENSQGKSELWYIIDCKENSQIICGIKNCENNIKNILNDVSIEKYLNYIDVKKGDYIYIEAGTVHALLGGILACEIQQNSDITYRIYDWNRKDKDGKFRELHKDKALEVIKKESKHQLKHINKIKKVQNITNNRHFSVDFINIKSSYNDTTCGETFYAYNVIEGNGELETKEKKYQLNIGDSFIIPSNLGNYKIIGKIKLLKSFI